MTAATLTPPAPPVAADDGFFRLTLDQYHRMGELGILTPDDRVELLDGMLVQKPMKKSPHRIATRNVRIAVVAVLPAGWDFQVQDPITLDDCEPEPDFAVIRIAAAKASGHPTPKDVPLVVEFVESSLGRDREWKRRIYARNRIPAYWIVNLVENTVEVFTDPDGTDYATTV
ncbi:MAG: Uma2 family endonuclease, partial [Fimbriiglobus sp.]